MQPVRRAKVDTIGRLRYLSPTEEQRVGRRSWPATTRAARVGPIQRVA